jgi:DNA-binding CsgD family transcriptional regulator
VTELARGVLESVRGTPAVALATLADAAEMLEPVGQSVLLPDSPAAVGALVGIQCGELAVAETLLQRAAAAHSGGPAFTARHRLLLAWVAMVRGNTELATQRLDAVGTELYPRDWLFAVGLRAGLARRASDLTALRMIWGEACDAVIRHRVDLFTLLPFGVFAVAAARLGDRERLAPHLRQARQLLHSLGDPPLWSTPLHWSGLHAAIMAEAQGEAREHVAALAASADYSRYHAVVAEAADCWLNVIAGAVDPARVEAAAKGLHGAGLWWDAARLAGQAAIRTTDRTAMVSLLECARRLQGGAAPAGPPDSVDGPALSERERQVAELVVAGMTYRQVGDQLFISAKTVEHHMARMRQRLGATSRGDLLTQLRSLVADGRA